MLSPFLFDLTHKGFASVEAKRKYISPRITPMLKHPNLGNEIFGTTSDTDADAESQRMMKLTTVWPESVSKFVPTSFQLVLSFDMAI